MSSCLWKACHRFAGSIAVPHILRFVVYMARERISWVRASNTFKPCWRPLIRCMGHAHLLWNILVRLKELAMRGFLGCGGFSAGIALFGRLRSSVCNPLELVSNVHCMCTRNRQVKALGTAMTGRVIACVCRLERDWHRYRRTKGCFQGLLGLAHERSAFIAGFASCCSTRAICRDAGSASML